MALASANSRDQARQDKAAQRQANAQCNPVNVFTHGISPLKQS